MKEIVPDVQTWSVFAPDKGYAFNGYAIGTENGTVLIDPPDPGADGWGTIDLLEPFAGIWLTNRNHSRAAAACRERYGLTVWAHEADADRLKAGADRTLRGGETIPGEVEVVHVDSRLCVEVRDDGRGGAETSAGSGLRGLADRVAALDGQIDIVSPTSGGTVLRVEIPCGS